MTRKEKKYHFIYKTTNLKNGKFYVGMHATNNLNDGYLGSGKRLRRSIRKYGTENFKLEILEFLPNRISLIEREKELVNADLLKDPMCMNLMQGGKGGFISEEQQRWRSICAAIASDMRRKNDLQLHIKMCSISSNNLKLSHKFGKIKYDTFRGKSHSEETKIKIGEANSLKQKGEANSQFGTCWINNGTKNKKIKKTEKLPKGWKFGRKIKTNSLD
jgi:group I intron endonuclease